MIIYGLKQNGQFTGFGFEQDEISARSIYAGTPLAVVIIGEASTNQATMNVVDYCTHLNDGGVYKDIRAFGIFGDDDEYTLTDAGTEFIISKQ